MHTHIFSRINGKVILCAALVLLADVLFYKQEFGCSFGIFGFAVLGAILLRNNKNISDYSRFNKTLITLTSLLLLSLFENLSMLSFCMTTLALITTAFCDSNRWQNNAVEWFSRIRCFAFTFWLRLPQDCLKDKNPSQNTNHMLRNWALPLIFSFIFISLFSDANPIIFQYIKSINLSKLLNIFSLSRIFFWLFIASFSWAIIRYRVHARRRARSYLPRKTTARLITYLFSPEAIFRSLVIFNILFLIQNFMDIKYLWIGTKTPQDLTMAQYVHQGAYPLVITALLAAIFVIISLKNSNSSSIQKLTYFWIAQNIFLVLSSISRTILYIESYSLTYLRVAGLIWMAIVVLGLAYIILAIAWKKSSLWLININVITVLTILYIGCFINFGYFISQYNVRSSFEATGQGRKLDIYYFNETDVSSLPAIKWIKTKVGRYSAEYSKLEDTERTLKRKLKKELSDWRGWSYRNYRISEGLDE